MHHITQTRLHELFSYCPDAGTLTRLTNRGGSKAGSIAGYKAPDGRIKIYVDNKNYNAHRLIWLHVYGCLPESEIDHIDGDPSNNRIANLREVSHQINLQNRQGPTTANTTGYMGVIRNKKRFGAQIVVDGVRVWLGTFDTPEIAYSVYIAARRKFLAGNTI